MIKNKYLFVFDNSDMTIVETKLLDMPIGSPPEKVYFWLKIDKKSNVCEKLSFVSMQKEPVQIREFKEGLLKFDSSKANFNGVDLDSLEINKISSSIEKVIIDFLSNC